jgi:hypothetical protein
LEAAHDFTFACEPAVQVAFFRTNQALRFSGSAAIYPNPPINLNAIKGLIPTLTHIAEDSIDLFISDLQSNAKFQELSSETDFLTIEQLRSSVKQYLVMRQLEKVSITYERDLLDILLKHHIIEIPRELLRSALIEHLHEEVAADLALGTLLDRTPKDQLQTIKRNLHEDLLIRAIAKQYQHAIDQTLRSGGANYLKLFEKLAIEQPPIKSVRRKMVLDFLISISQC